MRLSVFIIFIILFPFSIFAQGETDWWYFGEYSGIHFNNDTVGEVFDSELYSNGNGSTSLSDANGNLLFYGNGVEVYNSSHELIENTNFQIGFNSAALAIPNSDTLFAYFNTSYIPSASEVERLLGYSVLDINANNGLGELMEQQLSTDTILECIATIKKANGIDYWVVVRKSKGNTYITYSLDENGLDFENPIYSETGDDYPIEYEDQFTISNLRINPQGNILAYNHSYNTDGMGTTYFEGKLELFYFDNQNGSVGERIIRFDETNALSSSVSFHFDPYSTEFSSDGEKLYFTQSSDLQQCNITLLDSLSIIGSMITLDAFNRDYGLSGLQLAKDGRIYISTGLASSLSVVHHPNIFGEDADFELIGIELESYSGWLLPRFDPSFFSPGFTVSNRCLFEETQFTLIYDLPYEYVFWEFGDGDTSTEWEPTHVYSETGIYTVQLTTVIDDDTTQKEMEVIIEGYPSVELGPDSSLFCEGDTLVLDAYNYASYYTWQDSFYQSTFNVTDEGKYYVEVKNICGQDSDTVNFVLDRDNVHLGSDTLICIEEPLLLLADQATATSWLWQDGSTLPFYEAQQTGEYYVEVTTPCLFIYDSIYVDTKVCSLLPPNIITPNGDGINDYFVVENLYEFGYMWSIEIFNRWGQQVYFSFNYQNNWRGDHVNDGVYFYVLKSQDTDRSYNGSVTVLRK